MSNMIYTIGREFGSGGKAVGDALAARLGIKCYDKDLLQIAAKESGFCKEIFENHDEKPTNSFLYSLVMDTFRPVSTHLSMQIWISGSGKLRMRWELQIIRQKILSRKMTNSAQAITTIIQAKNGGTREVTI